MRRFRLRAAPRPAASTNRHPQSVCAASVRELACNTSACRAQTDARSRESGRQVTSKARARSARSTPARPSSTSRRSARRHLRVGQELVRGVQAGLADVPRRVQPDHHRLRDLARPPLPHPGDGVEVLARVNGCSSSAWPGWTKPPMIDRAVMLASVSSSITCCHAASFTAACGRAADACAACRLPAAVGSRCGLGVDERRARSRRHRHRRWRPAR